MPLLTISFQYMGDQLIVDLHELLVDLLVIFGVLVPDQRMVDFKVDHDFVSPLDHIRCLGPGLQRCFEVSLSIVEAGEVGVWVDMLVSVFSPSHFDSFVV